MPEAQPTSAMGVNPAIERLVAVHAGLFLAVLALMSLVNTAGAFPGTAEVPVLQWVPVYLPIMLVLLSFGLWIWWRRDGSLDAMRASVATPAWICLLGATGLFGYSLISAIVADQWVWVTRFHVPTPVPKQLVVMPPIQALVTVWTAFVVVAIVPASKRFVWLWSLAVALVPLSVMGWARVWIDDRSVRLWTQLGGAAVYPAVLMVGLAVAVAGVLRRYRPMQSQILTLCYLALLLLTGSRGALVMVVIFAVLAVVRLKRRHTGLGERMVTKSKRVFLMGGATVLLATFMSPVFSRIDLSGLDHGVGRVATWMIGFRAAANSLQSLLVGAGSGSIWPWFAYESGWQPIPWRSRVIGPFGRGLYHSHSVYVEVIGELGLVGVALLAVMVAPIVLQWLRGGSVTAMVLSSGTCACLVGFSVDTYLFKNFPVSLIWWLVVFWVLSAGVGASDSTVASTSTATDSATDDTSHADGSDGERAGVDLAAGEFAAERGGMSDGVRR